MGIAALHPRADLPRHGKSNPGMGLRQIDPTGKSLLIFRNRVKPGIKNISVFARPKSVH
jgi:hypothetical protein